VHLSLKTENADLIIPVRKKNGITGNVGSAHRSSACTSDHT
jgi:hypothetical protein